MFVRGQFEELFSCRLSSRGAAELFPVFCLLLPFHILSESCTNDQLIFVSDPPSHGCDSTDLKSWLFGSLDRSRFACHLKFGFRVLQHFLLTCRDLPDSMSVLFSSLALCTNINQHRLPSVHMCIYSCICNGLIEIVT
jgi:hypothetical protein